MILRIILIFIILPDGYNWIGFGYSPVYLLFDPFIQSLILFTPIIVFFLEKKMGFRFTPKFFQNKSAFIAYILFAIPTLIIEMIFIAFAICILIMSFGNSIDILFNDYDVLQDYIISNLLNPGYWIWSLIWVL